VYAQRIDADGNLKWYPSDGVPVCTATGNQNHIVMAAVGVHAAMIAWEDERNGLELDIYAMLISDETTTSVPETGPVFSYGSDVTITNHPNPFNPGTTITYHIPERCHVRLNVYDSLGRKITCLVNQEQELGYHTAQWDGRDEMGNLVGSGVYFSRLTAGNQSRTTKMVLLR
jgi:hypothetical protein